MASVEFRHIDKTYPDGTQAIADLSLTVADGELVVLVGSSGCGKSTLLRLLAGLEGVTRGDVLIGERVVNAWSPQARNVAMVFQDYALYPTLSVRGNLEFPLRMRGLPRGEVRERAERVAAQLGIAALLERLPRQLSGGQRQRVAMGRALVREPSVFLLDEPLSNLDAKLRVQVRAEIGELQRRTGTTMLYVTHDQVEAMTLGDRVAVLHQGRLQQVAPPQALYERPGNAFVAGFIGNPPMNLFPTRLAPDAHGRMTLALGEQRLPIDPAAVSAAPMSALPDRPLTAGIRPEALRLATSDATAGITATVDGVEYLGHETLAYVHAGPGAERLVARLPGMHALARGDAIRLCVDPAQVYLFDEDGRALQELPGADQWSDPTR